MERGLVQKGIDYLKKVGRQLFVSGSNSEVVENRPNVDNQKDKRPLSESIQSEIQNFDSELK